MHKKLAIPFACLSFLIIAFPLGVLVRKGGRLTGFIFAIGLIFIYYLFLSVGQTLGDDGRLPAWLAVWSANLCLGSLGALLSWATLNEKGGFLPSLR
jgi:lipopolysaccharide export LptBFGC system permease protein LptF